MYANLYLNDIFYPPYNYKGAEPNKVFNYQLPNFPLPSQNALPYNFV